MCLLKHNGKAFSVNPGIFVVGGENVQPVAQAQSGGFFWRETEVFETTNGGNALSQWRREGGERK